MAHYPTILIGYGAYGLRALRSFLAGAAARGALLWDEQASVGSLNDRRLHSLSLIWVPQTLGFAERNEPIDLLGGSSYELMNDVFTQIEEVSGSSAEIRLKLAEVVDREKKRLLDASRRVETRVSGLDLIVLAQPTHDGIIGFLRDSLEPAMFQLAADPAFASVQESGDTLLNFVHILDFEEYWEPRMQPVRAALQQVLNEHADAFAAGRPTVGRVYLFDGTTARGHRRSLDSRLQEVVLFLELLLLEGLRGEPDARALYRRERVNVPPVCTVGVRVVERSSGLLRRLAAAAFARNWLAYVGSKEGPDSAAPFTDLVAAFQGDLLESTAGARQLRISASRETARIEQKLLAVSAEQADWAESLRATAERETEAAVLRLSQESGAQSVSLAGGVLKSFREELERAITSSMQERSPALTLGSVIDALKSLEDGFVKAVSDQERPAEPPAPSGTVFEEAERMQREYGMYCARQVQTAWMARRWWPRAAILFALALSPVLLRAISELFPDSPVPVWVQAPLCALLLGGVFWAVGRRAIHAAIEPTAQRAREFYTDPERGRLAERVRHVAASPSVAGRIDSYSNRLIYGLKQYALGAVVAELRRARSILVKRREEIEWLQGQIGEFLVSYQVDSSGRLPKFQEGRAASAVRVSLERTEDLQAVAQSVPLGPDRYREFVAANQLFAQWSAPYCDTFLHPLPFLDQLSQKFQDRLELDEAESRRRADRISSFLETDTRVSPCFSWLAADSLPPAMRGSLFPALWRPLPGVRVALTTAGFSERVIETPNTDRMYLFEAVLGVKTELLMRPQ